MNKSVGVQLKKKRVLVHHVIVPKDHEIINLNWQYKRQNKPSYSELELARVELEYIILAHAYELKLSIKIHLVLKPNRV